MNGVMESIGLPPTPAVILSILFIPSQHRRATRHSRPAVSAARATCSD